MLIQLQGKEADNYIRYLMAYEERYKRYPKAPERTEAFFCALKGKRPSWLDSLYASRGEN